MRVAALAVGASLAALRAAYNGPSAPAASGGSTFAPAPRAATPAAATATPKLKRLVRSPARRAA